MNAVLSLLKTHRQSLIAFAVILLIGAGIDLLLENWTRSIVAVNTQRTQENVVRLAEASEHLVDSLWHAGFFRKTDLTKAQSHRVDSLFAQLTATQVRTVVGMEGGFYLLACNEMVGYSWPTSPSPPPAYGPAPRSYQIIHDQLVQTVSQRTPLTEFHQFDFATFPLATAPLFHEQEVVGSVWTRIHVERELPSSRIGRWLNIGLAIMVVLLVVSSVFSWRQRRQVDHMRSDLELLHSEPAHRLPEARGVLGSISRSINALVNAQQDDQRRREQLEQDLHQQDKMAMLGTLVTGVAHEVKTPLAIIKTRIQMWERDFRHLGAHTPSGEILSEESMQLILKEIDRLSGLVKRLLVFSKPFGTNRTSVDLNRLIEQTLSFVRADPEAQHIPLTLTLAPDLPRTFLDPHAIEQVLLNVCMNAIDAMPSGGTLEVSTSSDPHARTLRVYVRDTGGGIPADVHSRIFDPFFTTKPEGAGLGLYISRAILLAHGGSIEFSDRPEGGTECRITLPWRTSEKRSS